MNANTAATLPTIERLSLLCEKKRLPHAFLLVNTLGLPLERLLQSFTKLLLCQKRPMPCDQCQSCKLVLLGNHPDLALIAPEKTDGTIKIEQVRQLQVDIFNTPQIGCTKVIVISAADKLTISAANALLKILEEPPDNTYFLLVTQRVQHITPTIVSRCQQWEIKQHCVTDQLYPIALMDELDNITEQINSVFNKKKSLNAVAAQWARYNFMSLIEALYHLHAQMLRAFFTEIDENIVFNAKLENLATAIKPLILFKQIDKLNNIKKNNNQNTPVNHLLALEDFLIGYIE